MIPGLEPCEKYWVRVASVNCGSRLLSTPKPVDLHEEAEFRFIITLPAGVEGESRCSVWVTQAGNLADVEREVDSELVNCDLQVTCSADTALSCGSNHTEVIYR